MAVARPRTRPLRVREADHASLRAISALEGRVPAEIVHDALREYVARNGSTLSARFGVAQRVVASGDIDAVAEFLRQDTDTRVEALEAELKRLR